MATLFINDLGEEEFIVEAVPFYYYTGTDTLLPLFFAFDPNNIHTSTDNFDIDASVNVFPNPTKETISIRFNSGLKENIAWELINTDGKRILQETFLKGDIEKVIDLRDLPKGVYFYSFQSKNQILKKGKLLIH